LFLLFQQDIRIDVIIQDSGSSDYSADSESDFELSSYDPEMGPMGSDNWKCRNCKTPNPPMMSLCNKCWKVS
jgi:hypothetical protein